MLVENDGEFGESSCSKARFMNKLLSFQWAEMLRSANRARMRWIIGLGHSAKKMHKHFCDNFVLESV